MILPKDRGPRFITIRRGGTLTECDHRLLALWAAGCAEHVLHVFESAQPSDPRPREAAAGGLGLREGRGGRRERQWPGVDRATVTAAKLAGRGGGSGASPARDGSRSGPS
jgi:immunity protein 5 of polymorphic toxin system